MAECVFCEKSLEDGQDTAILREKGSERMNRASEQQGSSKRTHEDIPYQPFHWSAFLSASATSQAPFSRQRYSGCPDRDVQSAVATRFSLIVPGMLDADVEEKLVVEGFGYTRAQQGNLILETANGDFIKEEVFILNEANKYQKIISIQISSEILFLENQLRERKVFLKVTAEIEKKKVYVYPQLLVTQGHIFTQVKEPVYTPGQKVKCRIFAVQKSLLPLQDKSTITAEIRDPDNYVVFRKSLELDRYGMTQNFDFGIPKVTKYGRWLIQSCFGEVCKTNYTTEFQVREYVEPTFDVKISPERSYFHVSDNELRVKIEARYTFGYDVNGRAYVRYGIIEQEKKTPLHWNLIDIENGEGEILILKNKLTTNGTMEHLVGRNIFVQASVMGHSVGELQEAELTSVIILKAKYTLVVQKSSSFFKPNNPYSFQVLVKNPDGSVASGVKVTSVEKEEEKSTKSNKDGIAKFTFNTGKGMRELNIKIYTDEPMQAIAMWKVFPYSSKRDYLLVISPRSLTTKLNEELRLDLKAHLSNEKNDVDAFSYMVISKGSVVKAAKIQSVGFSTAISLLITKEMVPSFRVVGYYHHGGEFVSDSVQIDVETGCDTPLKLSRNMKSQTIPPDVKVPITIEGESKSRVALVAVDKAAYVNNPNNRVTSKQVFAALETFDRTCSPGGGKDAMGVFHDSGLIFAATNGDRSTDKAFQCFEQSRKKKRSLEDYLKFLSDLVEEYKVEQKRRCCSDGQRINLPEETCESRAEFVTEKDDCREIYKKCCKDAYDERYYLEYEEEEEMDVHARNANEFLEKDVYIRNDFPLSFFWETHDLDKNSMIVSRTVPHSITTWELQAISISDNQGICVADPLDIIVFEPLFAKIHLPYSIRRNDQADMRVIVYNYLSLEQRVHVTLEQTSDLCSSAGKGASFEQTAKLKANDIFSFTFTVMPLELGSIPFHIRLRTSEKNILYEKKLNCVPEGILHKISQSFLLSPGKSFVIPNDMPSDIVPNSDSVSFLSIKGNLVAESVANSLDGETLQKLITQPTGCGEQTASKLACTLEAMRYLDSTKQWENIGFGVKEDALDLLKTGYAHLLTYKNHDHSFRYFPSSVMKETWLTAFVIRVMKLGINYLPPAVREMCGSVKWLITERQTDLGSFREEGAVYSSKVRGKTAKQEKTDVLTAFVAIALHQSTEFCKHQILQHSLNQAVNFLKGRIPNIQSPYTLAIVAYALELIQPGSESARNAAQRLYTYADIKDDVIYWALDGKMAAGSIETTSYALMYTVLIKDWHNSKKIASWLASKRQYAGGFFSTQDTTTALNALTDYEMQAADPELDLHISITDQFTDVEQRKIHHIFDIKKKNAVDVQGSEIPLGGNLIVTVGHHGNGLGTLSFQRSYNAFETGPEEKAYKMSVTVKKKEEEGFPMGRIGWFDARQRAKRSAGEAFNNIYSITLIIRYQPKDNDISRRMTIIDVALPPTFKANKKSLQLISGKKVDAILQSFEEGLGKVVLYTEKINTQKDVPITFNIEEKLQGPVEPLPITVYQYYNPEEKTTFFYHPKGGKEDLARFCDKTFCQCLQGSCPHISLNMNISITADQRMDILCNGVNDYALKMKIDDINHQAGMTILTTTITEPLKRGYGKIEPGFELRFVFSSACEAIGKIQEGKTYLAIGVTSKNIADVNRPPFILGHDSWIEFWPEDAECNGEAREFCKKKRDFENEVLLGCGI